MANVMPTPKSEKGPLKVHMTQMEQAISDDMPGNIAFHRHGVLVEVGPDAESPIWSRQVWERGVWSPLGRRSFARRLRRTEEQAKRIVQAHQEVWQS